MQRIGRGTRAAAQNEGGRDIFMRKGKPYLGPVKAKFHDLELRVAMMAQQVVDMQALSPASSYSFYWMVNSDPITHSRTALENLVSNFGAEHVVMGNDFPYDVGDAEPVESVQRTDIEPGDKNKIFSENACKLLGIGS